jgi:hypothetical protein
LSLLDEFPSMHALHPHEVLSTDYKRSQFHIKNMNNIRKI